MTRKPESIENTTEIAGVPRFDVAALHEIAGERVFARGSAYHEERQVEIVAIDRTRVRARVIGSEVYRSELVGAGKKFSGTCSCRAFAEWGFCKHLVATALAANCLGSAELEQVSSRFAKIREHLRGRGLEGLVEIVVRLAERDSSLLEELELSVVAADADDTTLLAHFKKSITEVTRTLGYVEYPKMLGWVQGIESVLDAGLAEYRRLASDAWRKIRPLRAAGRQVQDDQFRVRYALGAILETFAERDGDVDGIIAIRAKDLSTAHDYLGIAQLCLDHARELEALKWAEEGLWQFEDAPDERLIFFASDLYRRIGREEDAEKLLWRTFERRPGIELYKRLKAAAGSDRMRADAVRDRALAWLRTQIKKSTGRWSSPTEIFVRLAMMEGQLTDAWMVVNKQGCHEALLGELAEASEHSHPPRC